MKALSITSENGETFSSISNIFIDYHMTQANGEFVKIYLYLVRLLQAGRSVDIQDVADHFQCTQKDICRAIRYWADHNILRLEHNQAGEPIGITVLRPAMPNDVKESDINSGFDLLHKASPVTSADSSVATMNSSVTSVNSSVASVDSSVVPFSDAPAIPEKKTYSATAIRNFGKDAQMESILYQFEIYWGHTPTNTEYQTILYIYEQLEFPAELLEYLIEYCATVEHTSHRYMEKVAIDWFSRQILTAEKAKEEHSAYRALNNAISKELGLNRVLTPTELRYINTWKNDYSFNQEIIVEACQRASASNKISFRYINGTLTSWYENQVQTLDDIRRLDEAYENQKKSSGVKSGAGSNTNKVANLAFNDFDQRNYDNQELEDFFIGEVQKTTQNKK